MAILIASSFSSTISLILSFTSGSLGSGGIYDEPPMVTGTPRMRPPSAKNPH